MKRIILITKMLARVGIGLLLMVLIYSCATVPGLREEAPGTYIRVPFVRVLLDESQESVAVSADDEYAVECLIDGRQEVYYVNRPVVVYNYGSYLTVKNDRGVVVQADLGEVNVIPRGNGNNIHVLENRYRGIVKFLPSGRTIQVLNIVYMEDYLRGVVPPEIGPRTREELEAVKAQAVAARTYALAHLQQYTGRPYDMKSSIMDQVYDGVKVENRLVNEAIDATTGQVLTYQGDFIQAYYHSTCGGMTDDIEDVWDRKEIPYLKAVEDSGACSWSKYYTWQEDFTEKQLRGRVEQYLSSDRGRDLKINTITDVRITERSAGGRVTQMVIRAGDDVYRFRKDRIRWVIGRTSNPDLILPSDRFDVVINRNLDGSLKDLTFKGRGYGHGVGMCQCGAIGMSREGWTFDRILKFYFTGVDLEKMY